MTSSAKDLSQIASQIAAFKTSTMGTLTANAKDSTFDIAALASQYFKQQDQLNALVAPAAANSFALNGVSALGRNLALPDAESAYQMMSEINHRAQVYPAQKQVLGEMQNGVKQLAQAVAPLAQIDSSLSASELKNKIQCLADQYNSWRLSFDADVQDPDLLADTQAAHMARYELAASISSPFHGANNGRQGLSAIGIAIDPNTNMVKIDGEQLASAWQQQPEAVVAALGDFASDFKRSADLLSSENNFFQKQLGNLQRAMTYLDDNLPQLQQEFGLGDPATPSKRVAQVLAEYQANQTQKT